MPGITKARFNEVQTTARQIIAEHGGREHLDNLPKGEFKPVSIAMSHQLASREGIGYQTARQHIARAMRRLRGEFVKDGRVNNGGQRPGAGRPSIRVPLPGEETEPPEQTRMDKYADYYESEPSGVAAKE